MCCVRGVRGVERAAILNIEILAAYGPIPKSPLKCTFIPMYLDFGICLCVWSLLWRPKLYLLKNITFLESFYI